MSQCLQESTLGLRPYVQCRRPWVDVITLNVFVTCWWLLSVLTRTCLTQLKHNTLQEKMASHTCVSCCRHLWLLTGKENPVLQRSHSGELKCCEPASYMERNGLSLLGCLHASLSSLHPAVFKLLFFSLVSISLSLWCSGLWRSASLIVQSGTLYWGDLL